MKGLRIEIDDKSGFCFGVVRAISEAEKALAEGSTVYSLGDIVHNRIEVQRLERLGLRTVTHADMPALGGRRLFIRAHGEPPTTFARAKKLGIGVIDATCPVVARLQNRVVKAHEQMHPVGGQVVILGKRGHAEVVGLTGQVQAPTIVIEGEEDLGLIDFTRPVYFLSQTTQSIALFEPRTTPGRIRTPLRRGGVRLRAQVVERQGALGGVPQGERPDTYGRGGRRDRPGMVPGCRVGRNMRRHVDPQMADAGGCRPHRANWEKMINRKTTACNKPLPQKRFRMRSKLQTAPAAATTDNGIVTIQIQQKSLL